MKTNERLAWFSAAILGGALIVSGLLSWRSWENCQYELKKREDKIRQLEWERK